MVKVESNMLVLDAGFSRQDADAINHFVEIAKAQERERIVAKIKRQICFDALEDHEAVAEFRIKHPTVVGRCGHHGGKCTDLLLLVEALINEESK
jgi:hypothetical protein